MLYLNNLATLVVAFVTVANCQKYLLRTSLPSHSLDGQLINAQGRAFYTGLSGPATYCPTVVEPNCPKNPYGTTIFAGLIGLQVRCPIPT